MTIDSGRSKNVRGALGFMLRGRVLHWMIAGNLAAILLGGTEMAIALALQLILQMLEFQFGGTQLPGPLKDWAPDQATIVLIFVLLITARAGLTFLSQMSSTFAYVLIQIRLKLNVFFKLLQRQRPTYLSAAEINFRNTEMASRASSFVSSTNNLLNAGLLAAVLLTSMCWLSWKLTLVSVGAFALVGFAVMRINRFVGALALQQPEKSRAMIRGIERIARNWLLIRILRMQDLEYERLVNLNLGYARLDTRISALNTAVALLPVLVGGFLILALIYANVAWLHVAPGIFLSFLYTFLRFQNAVGAGMAQLSKIAASKPHFLMAADILADLTLDERVMALRPASGIGLLGSGRDYAHPSSARQMDSSDIKAPSIEAADIRFRYTPDQAPVFAGINLTVPAGGQVAIVGPSGSGKSTLLACLLGVAEPEHGHILIAGQAPVTYFLSSAVRVGYVGPEAFLTEGTILDNVRYGVPDHVDKTDSACIAALRRANLHALLDGDPNFPDRHINENGDGLSAGEKQRLGLARALLARPHVLILDEVSANLDEQAEQVIVEVVAGLKGDCTTVIVSHRKGMLAHADRIISMDELAAPLATATEGAG